MNRELFFHRLRNTAYLLIACALMSQDSVAQKKKVPFEYNTLENTTGKTTIGLGMIIDTPSNISCQYQFYELFANNPIEANEKETVIPVITNKRGLTSFYLEGIYSMTAIDLKLWKQGTLLNRIRITPLKPVNEAPGEEDIKQMYAQLTAALTNQPLNAKLKVKDMDILEPTDKLVDKDLPNIGDFIYASAISYVPPITFKKDLYNIYSNGRLETEYLELKDFKGDKFKFKSFEEYVEKNYITLASLYQTPSFFPKDPMKAAQTVHTLYKIRQSDHFFFTSKFVDDKAKIACRKVVFPLWKRPGTALTYCLAADEFGKNGYVDQAIQSYYSSLMMSDAVNTYPSFGHYIKSRVYSGLAENFSKENNTAYAMLSQELGILHRTLIKSEIIKKRSAEYDKLSTDIVSYFTKIETTAHTARTEKRSAFWNTLGGIALAATSAVNDGQNGLTTLSPETQGLLNAATDNMVTTGDFKFSSLSASAEAAQAFSKVYGDIVRQMQSSNNAFGVADPIMSKDFVNMLGDKELAQENKNAILDFSKKFPMIQSEVTNYLNAVTDADRVAQLQTIYRKMAKTEMEMYIKESVSDKTGAEIFNAIN